MQNAVQLGPRVRLAAIVAAFAPAAALSIAPVSAAATAPTVRLVGTYHGIQGQYRTIQSAVDAAGPGDWILVAPGDYHERADYADPSWPAGVWIDTPGIHLRGMDRNRVIVDGTKVSTAAGACSSAPAAQDLGPNGQGRNGIEVYGPNFTANGVTIDNLTVCNFLTSIGGGNGNQIWWNGGDGKGKVGLKNYTGTYLTATSTYASSTSGSLGPCCGVSTPAGSYGIFSSDSTHGLWQHDYASNMADSAYYLGACQQVCDMTMEYDHGQYSSLCLSSTNAGGYFLVQHNECDKNKTGLVNNSQNNDDWPSPQLGACDLGNKNEPQKGVLGTTSCTVWQYNNLHDNNDPDVPGNGIGGLAGGGPVGTGLILAGSSNITLYQNTIQHNNSWGELIVDLPDPESGAANCQGGTWVPSPVGVCYYPTYGNTSLDNRFASNGAYGNATNGDIGYAHTPFPNMPGSCFAGDRDPLNGKPNSATTDPPGIEGNPLYAPANGKGPCTQTNSGDMGPLVFEALCASQLLAPCPTIESVVCQLWPSSAGTCPLANFKPIPANYPRPDSVFKLTFPAPSLTPTMPNPCAGVPANPWCKASSRPVALSGMSAAPAAAVGVGIAAALAIGSRRRRRP